jgi:hypothetical protein
MPEFARVHVFDETKVPAETPHEISFRPVQPGPVTIMSVPRRHPQKSQAETGVLGTLRLSRPGIDGHGVMLKTETVKIDQPHLFLSFDATAADLAAPGDWTCEVSNETLLDIVFDTDIAYVSKFPLQTASFDIGLLNLLLAEFAAAAEFRLRVVTSADANDASSSVAWSDNLARALNGQRAFFFHRDDIHILRDLLDLPDGLVLPADVILPDELIFRAALDSGPLAAPTFNPGATAFEININFGTPLIPCLDPDALDIEMHSLTVLVALRLDGTIQANCEANAQARINGHPVKDVSGQVEAGVQGAMAGIHTPRQVRALLEPFFVRLMRLNDTPVNILQQFIPFKADAHIDRYSVDGQQLIVHFYSVPRDNGIVTHP